MKNCPKCGCDLQELKEPETKELVGESKAKDEVLAELIEMMQGSLGSKLGKPAMVSVEMVSKKKDDDLEDEDE